jgi:putative membrane protein
VFSDPTGRFSVSAPIGRVRVYYFAPRGATCGVRRRFGARERPAGRPLSYDWAATMAKIMTEAAEAAFRDAIQAIEKLSSAEVVIAVRPRVRRVLVPNVAVGAVAMAAVLAFMLFSENAEFALWSIAVAPLLAALAGGLLVEVIAPVERALMTAGVREACVREAARAAFYELGVHRTKGRTGVLVFVAVRERRVELVGDLAIVERFGDAGLTRHAAGLIAALPAGGEAVARALAALAGEYGTTLPRAADDVNELADLVLVRRPPRRRRGSVR